MAMVLCHRFCRQLIPGDNCFEEEMLMLYFKSMALSLTKKGLQVQSS